MESLVFDLGSDLIAQGALYYNQPRVALAVALRNPKIQMQLRRVVEAMDVEAARARARETPTQPVAPPATAWWRRLVMWVSRGRGEQLSTPVAVSSARRRASWRGPVA